MFPIVENKPLIAFPSLPRAFANASISGVSANEDKKFLSSVILPPVRTSKPSKIDLPSCFMMLGIVLSSSMNVCLKFSAHALMLSESNFTFARFFIILRSLENRLTNFLTAGVSLKLPHHSFSFSIAPGSFSTRPFIDWANKLSCKIQSWKATSISPIFAVKLRIFRSNAPKIVVRTLNAMLSPPPAIVRTMSRTANKPLKVLFNCFTPSSLNFNFSVKL